MLALALAGLSSSSSSDSRAASWSVESLEALFEAEGTDKQGRAPGHSYVET